MALVIALLLAIVAFGMGGHAPWALLTLELGALAVFSWWLIDLLWHTSPETRSALLEHSRAWRRLPLGQRQPWWGRLGRIFTLGRLSRSGASVEIVPPDTASTGLLVIGRPALWRLGYPFRRTGLGWWFGLLTVWIAGSLLPLESHWLEALSPRAHALRLDALTLVDAAASGWSAPTSLSPFLTLRDFWLWLAYLALFVVTVHLGADARRARQLTGFLLLVGVGYGLHGILQWLWDLQELLSPTASAAYLRATGPFGNRNHYALFMEVLLFVGLGWLGHERAASSRERRGERSSRRQEVRARLFLIGVGIASIGLGLLFSLSRAGISLALLGSGAFALLARPQARPALGEPIDAQASPGVFPRRGVSGTIASPSVYWALAFGILAIAFWIGLEPIVTRFQLAPDDWAAETGRARVWSDSSGAVRDFWLTGSGLGSFASVFPSYRSFGGRVFYSWAHNDYLQLLIELGLPGLLLVLGLLASMTARTLDAHRRLRDHPSLVSLHAGYASAALVVVFHSFFDFGLHLPANAALVSVVAGMAVGMTEPRRRPSSRDPETQVPWVKPAHARLSDTDSSGNME